MFALGLMVLASAFLGAGKCELRQSNREYEAASDSFEAASQSGTRFDLSGQMHPHKTATHPD